MVGLVYKLSNTEVAATYQRSLPTHPHMCYIFSRIQIPRENFPQA